jgi:hypothetical protein
MSTSTAMKLAAGTAAHSRSPSSDSSSSKKDSESGRSKEAAWQLCHTYSTAVECFTGAGHTARMSAAATAVKASASSTNSAAGAAAALRAQVSTGRLCANPIPDSSRQKGGADAGCLAGIYRQQPPPQPAKQAAASNTSYAVLPALSPASSSTSGTELLGASCVLTTPKEAVVTAERGSDTSTGRRHMGSSVGSSAAVRRQVAGVTAQAFRSGAGPASVSAGSRLAGMLLPVSGCVLLGAGLVAAGLMV